MAFSAEQAGAASGKWARSLTINAAALVICRYVFSGFEIHDVPTYLAAAAAIEIPTILWLLAVHGWNSTMFHERLAHWPLAARKLWRAALLVLVFVIPLALATTAPGIAVAAGITSLKITGVWSFVGASAITAALTIGLGSSRPLKFVRSFVRGFAPDDERRKSEDANRAFREARHEAGAAVRDLVLHWWATHRTTISWTLRGLRIAALIAGTVAVGFWFGVVLALIVWLLPAAILWPMVRSHKKSRVPG